jgi:hypothetical protein
MKEGTRRTGAATCLAVVIAAGLLSRRFPLPGVLAEHTGDALWTVAVFCLLAVAMPGRRTLPLAVLAFVVSAAVEATQLLRWQWLVDLRATTAGALLLGQGFQWADFVAYAAGAIGAAAIDRLLRSDRTGFSPPLAPGGRGDR